MKRFFLFTLLTCFTAPLFSQGSTYFAPLSSKVKKIVKAIEDDGEFMGAGVGFAGTRPPQYDNFLELKQHASKEQLLALTSHKSPAVRCYAFWALCYHQDADIFPVVKEHLRDEKQVMTMSGCVSMDQMAGDIFINLSTPGYYGNELKKLSYEERKIVDSLLIFSDSKLYARNTAIENAGTRFYPRMKTLVAQGEMAALPVIARYKNPEDVAIIAAAFEEHTYIACRAISFFPHADFKPLLEKELEKTLADDHQTSSWKHMYMAIAAYKDDWSLQNMQRVFTGVKHENIKTYHIDYLHAALETTNDPFYDDLLWKLWEYENKVSLNTFYHLWSVQPLKAAELSKRTLMSPSSARFDYAQRDSLMESMLDLVMRTDTAAGKQVMIKNLSDANVHEFGLFARKAGQWRDKDFVAPLFDRYEREWNAHIYLAAAKALLKYDDREIKKRLIDSRKKNEALNKEWGGEALDKLLK